MKDKSFYLFNLTFILLLSITVYAKPVTFSDDFVSFTYDDEPYQLITQTSFSNYLWYYVETDLQITLGNHWPSSSVSIRLEKDSEDDFLDSFFSPEALPDTIVIDDLSDREKKYTYLNGAVYYRKLIATHDDQYIVALFYASDEENENAQYCRSIYGSIAPTDTFSVNGFLLVDDFGWTTKTIYRKTMFSQELKDYVEQGIRICERYLAYNMSDDEVKEKLLALREAIKNDFTDSGYPFDMSVIEFIPDSSVFYIYSDKIEVIAIETKHELEKILNEINEQYL